MGREDRVSNPQKYQGIRQRLRVALAAKGFKYRTYFHRRYSQIIIEVREGDLKEMQQIVKDRFEWEYFEGFMIRVMKRRAEG